jgi:hypothetical protein
MDFGGARMLRIRVRTLMLLVLVVGVGIWFSLVPRCPLHGRWMKPVTVLVTHGRFDLWDPYLSARNSDFPHCDDPVRGLCRGGPPWTATIDVCSRCNVERAAWKAAYRPPPQVVQFQAPYDPSIPPPPPEDFLTPDELSGNQPPSSAPRSYTEILERFWSPH